jgi:crotonobetainyl-CoA:carnitine CoA-transferase CaiB-like acyl-CoA transferase
VQDRAVLRPIIAERLGSDTTAAWLVRLDAAEIPSGPINDVLTALEQPQAQARSMDVTVEHPRLGPIRQVGVPFKLSATPATIRSAPPLLGEQTDEILADLGFGLDQIEALHAGGVV